MSNTSSDFNFFDDDIFGDIVGVQSEQEAAQYSGEGGSGEFKLLDRGKYIIEFISADFRVGASTQFPVINTEFKAVAKINESGMLERPNNFGKIKKALMLFTYPMKRIYSENGRFELSTDTSKRFDVESIKGQGLIVNDWECKAYTALLLRLTRNTQLNDYFAKKKFTVKPTRNQEEHIIYKSFRGDEKGISNGITNTPAIVEEWCSRLENYNANSNNGTLPFSERNMMVAMVDIIQQKNKGELVINENTGEPYMDQVPITERGWYTMFVALSDLDVQLLNTYEQDITSGSTTAPSVVEAPSIPGDLDDVIPF